MDALEKAEMRALRESLRFYKRKNALLLDLATHECAICRCCTDRERLVARALGRQSQTLRAENPHAV